MSTINKQFLGIPNQKTVEWLRRPTYTINIQTDTTKGIVEFPTSARKYSSVTIKAIPNEGYKFVRWSDGNVNAIREIAVNDNVYLEAIFDELIPIPEDMLTFTAVGKFSTIQLNKVGTPYDVSLEYRVDVGKWKTFTPGSTTINLNAGQKAYLRSTIEDPEGTNSIPFSKDSDNFYQFAMTGKIAASGNIQYLLDKTGQRMSVPKYCYDAVFARCPSLTQAPELPATTLNMQCYRNMFQECTSLTQAPELPATTLANNCYGGMFAGCSSLTQAPELPATTLANECYFNMFDNCSSLTQVPELPATTLANGCYHYMFDRCTKVNGVYITNLTESEYNAEKAAKNSGQLGREGQATFHFKQ